MPEEVADYCRSLYDLMCRFWSSFGHRMNNALVRGGINIPQYMAMLALAELGETTMGELSKKLHVTMGASTNIVDKLVRAGYVTRNRSTEDRRIVRVKLQPKGETTIEEVENMAVNFMVGVLKEVEPQRRKQFMESYGRMVTIVEAQETTETLSTRSPG